MSLIGANAFSLLASIKGREDGNLTLPVFESTGERKKSSCVLIYGEERFKARYLTERENREQKQ